MTDGFKLKKKNTSDKVIALAGNPNVGKSTVFNNLTGMKQHTGNWPGKTVSVAQGYANSKNNSYEYKTSIGIFLVSFSCVNLYKQSNGYVTLCIS